MIGAFHQPRLVLADLAVLASLPAREMACGYAEILKAALLGDAGFFAWLEANSGKVLARDADALAEAVERAVAIKARIVAADEREAGARALLNLGHTFGHAIEAAAGFADMVKHGEAVGLGCALAFRFSAELGLCRREDAQRAAAAVVAAGLPATFADLAGGPYGAAALIGHMDQDKKTAAAALNLIAVRGIGEAFVASDIDRAGLAAFLRDEGATA